MLSLRIGTSDALARYVAKQLQSLFPAEGIAADEEKLVSVMPGALRRMKPILAAVRNFQPKHFDHFHSLQYASFLYLLSSEYAMANMDKSLAERLCLLNRALNSLDLFYGVQMPEVFFLSHVLSTVLGAAIYGNGLVVFQGVTVGRVADARPEVGADVILYPGAKVTGSARIGDRCVIGAGVQIHGTQVPTDSVVLLDSNGRQVMRPRRKDYTSLYLRRDCR